MSWSLSFVLNIDFPGNSCLDKKGKEKSCLTPKKERITIVFGQKVGFLRRKCAFSPKKSNISSEEKSTCERTFRPISLYVLADTTVCIGSHERMCARTRAIKSDFQAFSADFRDCFPIVSQVLYWAIFPCNYGILFLLLEYFNYMDMYCSLLVSSRIFLTSSGSPISMVLVSLPGISQGKRGYFDKMIIP